MFIRYHRIHVLYAVGIDERKQLKFDEVIEDQFKSKATNCKVKSKAMELITDNVEK